jgi:hypothetical protein
MPSLIVCKKYFFWGKIFLVLFQGANPWGLTENFLGDFLERNNELM